MSSGYRAAIELAPRLIPTAVPPAASGVVLVLHGGARRGARLMVSPAQLSVIRMVPIARLIARAGRGRLAVYRVLNSRRGWDATHTPVDDVAWALDELEAQLGALPPVCLVGHSLGGRAALLGAGHPAVEGAVALAPWVLPTDPVGGLAGKRALIVHGSNDRIADPRRAAALAERVARVADTRFLLVRGGRHAMLRHHRAFSRAAAEFAVATLLEHAERAPLSSIADQPTERASKR